MKNITVLETAEEIVDYIQKNPGKLTIEFDGTESWGFRLVCADGVKLEYGHEPRFAIIQTVFEHVFGKAAVKRSL